MRGHLQQGQLQNVQKCWSFILGAKQMSASVFVDGCGCQRIATMRLWKLLQGLAIKVNGSERSTLEDISPDPFIPTLSLFHSFLCFALS